jgi:RNA polymerase II subunit A-like phosphatase
MTHDALGVTVSAQVRQEHLAYKEEAARIENENATRLFSEKKLSLILDLDQTIIHATVDPTVGEWMADPDNPNFPALKVRYWYIE